MTDETLLQILRSSQSSDEDVVTAFSRLFIAAKDDAAASTIVKTFIENHPAKAKQLLANLNIPSRWLPEDFSFYRPVGSS